MSYWSTFSDRVTSVAWHRGYVRRLEWYPGTGVTSGGWNDTLAPGVMSKPWLRGHV